MRRSKGYMKSATEYESGRHLSAAEDGMIYKTNDVHVMVQKKTDSPSDTAGLNDVELSGLGTRQEQETHL